MMKIWENYILKVKSINRTNYESNQDHYADHPTSNTISSLFYNNDRNVSRRKKNNFFE